MLDFDVKVFIILFVALSFDWIFQTQREAYNKFRDWRVRAMHATKYAALSSILLALFTGGVVYIWVFLYLFITHYWVDNRKFVKWIITRVKKSHFGNTDNIWLEVAIDQWLHIWSIFILSVIIGMLGMGVLI